MARRRLGLLGPGSRLQRVREDGWGERSVSPEAAVRDTPGPRGRVARRRLGFLGPGSRFARPGRRRRESSVSPDGRSPIRGPGAGWRGGGWDSWVPDRACSASGKTEEREFRLPGRAKPDPGSRSRVARRRLGFLGPGSRLQRVREDGKCWASPGGRPGSVGALRAVARPRVRSGSGRPAGRRYVIDVVEQFIPGDETCPTLPPSPADSGTSSRPSLDGAGGGGGRECGANGPRARRAPVVCPLGRARVTALRSGCLRRLGLLRLARTRATEEAGPE